MSKVSVVIPAYNAELYLAEAIESILSQTFKNLEIIIIDDCSTDGTWDVISHYANMDTRIKTYSNKKNLGIAGNRNKGVSLATGDYLAWQDADDISLPHRIEKQHEYMEQHSEVGIVGGYLELFRGDHVLGIRKYPSTDPELRKCIFRYSPVAQPAAMVRMSALNKVGQYNLKYPPAEDLDMTFRIGHYYKLANLSEVVIKYRESDTSATFTRLRKMEMSTLEIRKNNFYSQGYHASLIDIIYNLLHFISIWIIPPTLKIRLFNLFRNT